MVPYLRCVGESMPRKPRLFVPNAIYHVYCRTARGEYVFDDQIEADAFVETVSEVRDLDGLSILAWCLLGNHYHLVLRTRTVPLWRSMARIQGKVARGHNRRRRCLGRLWQSRYKARVIETNDYFRQVVAYVHLNPVAAGLVDDPARYSRCGHAEAIGAREPGLLNVNGLLSGFGGIFGVRNREDYLAAVRAVAEVRWLHDGVERLPWWIEAKHTDEIAREEDPQARTFEGLKLEDGRRFLEIGEVSYQFERATGHFIRDLAGRSRDRELIEGRIEFTAIAVGRYCCKVCDVARKISKHSGSVSRWLTMAAERENRDPAFRTHLDHIDRTISSQCT